jgi:tRNA nucleotidyltransferase (CCA-adding enzyme)
MNPLFVEAIPILDKIEASGYEAVFVGGSVRDHLLNKNVHDVDIATSAPPNVIQELFAKTIPVGIEHGTVLVRYGNKSYEVTTYRIDGEYSDHRHPDDVYFVSNLSEDLARRDFTINAMAMDKKGTIIDPFNGKSDLAAKVIQTVNHPDDRFNEDPLRMMRALRFVSQLGFRLEERTERAISTNIFLLEKIAVERIAVEMEKLLMGNHLISALKIMDRTKIHSYLPVFKEKRDLFEKSFSHIQAPFESMAEAITFFHLINNQIGINAWCKKWKLSNAIKKSSEQLLSGFLAFTKSKTTPEYLYELEPKLLADFVHLVNTVFPNEQYNEQKVRALYNELPIKSKQDLKINGNEILAFFPEKKPGPWLKDLIQRIEKEVLLGNLANENGEIKEWIKVWKQPEND